MALPILHPTMRFLLGLACLLNADLALHAEELPLTPNASVQDFQNRQEDTKPYNFDAPPEGLFRTIVLARGFEEELGFRQAHEIVPVGPTTEFAPDSAVFVVFHVHQHYEPYQVFAVCFPENVAGLDSRTQLMTDAMLLALEDETGYVKLEPPPRGWKPGHYKVNIHVGWKANDLTHMGVMRFTVSDTAPSDQASAPHRSTATPSP